MFPILVQYVFLVKRCFVRHSLTHSLIQSNKYDEDICKHMADNVIAATRVASGGKAMKSWAGCFTAVNNDCSGCGPKFPIDLLKTLQDKSEECFRYADVVLNLRMVTVDLPAIPNLPTLKNKAAAVLRANAHNKWGTGINEAMVAIAAAQPQMAARGAPNAVTRMKRKQPVQVPQSLEK